MNGSNDMNHVQSDLGLETTKIEQEALNRQIKLGKATEHVISLIHGCARSGSRFLDLSKKNIASIPEELLSLSHITHLYLEGNNLTILPEDFFQKLSSLLWLDLRNNNLKALPSAYIGSHKKLTHLLLQGNQLQTIPLELAQTNNNSKVTTSTENSESDEELTSDEYNRKAKLTSLSKEHPSLSKERPLSAKSDTSEITGKMVSLHRQQSYQDIKKDRMDKITKAGASGKLDQKMKKSSSSRHMDVNLFPEPPSVDTIDMKVRERHLQAITREKNEKIDAILQRRKDEEKLRKFRDDAKAMQRQKDYDKYINGGYIDYIEPASQAPFDISNDNMKILTNEERIKQGVKEQHERIRKVLSPRAIKQRELEKVAKEKEIKEKIKEHTDVMKVRRKKTKGTPQEEMNAAMRELEIAKRLQQELDQRRKNLDYRLRAYNPPF